MDRDIGKQELLQRLQSGYARFQQLIAHLTPAQLQAPGVIGRWSIKDLIAHFIAHEQFALSEIAAAQRGEKYHSPFQDSDEINAAVVEQYADTPAEEVFAAWETSFRGVVAAVQALADAEFAADGAVARLLEDTIDGALANNTYEHYAEHTPAVAAWIGRLAQ